jgi:acetoacetyl-CoA synthetase
MMYNFLVAGLQTGCALVLYDGSPLRDPPLLWRWVDELKITHFGTSAKYLDALSVCIEYTPLHRASFHLI